MRLVRETVDRDHGTIFPLFKLECDKDVSLIKITLDSSEMPTPLNGDVLKKGVVLDEKWSCMTWMALSEVAFRDAVSRGDRMPPRLSPDITTSDFRRLLKPARMHSEGLITDPA